MSKTITIRQEYELTVENAQKMLDSPSGYSLRELKAVRKALEESKSNYDLWRENRCFPWVGNRVVAGEVECTDTNGDVAPICSVRFQNTARLIAAAPDMLDVLLDLYNGGVDIDYNGLKSLLCKALGDKVFESWLND